MKIIYSRWEGKTLEDRFEELIPKEWGNDLILYEKYLFRNLTEVFTPEYLEHLFIDILPLVNCIAPTAFFASKGRKRTRHTFTIDLLQDDAFLLQLVEQEFINSTKNYSEIFAEMGVDYKPVMQLMIILFLLKTKKSFRNLDLYEIFNLDRSDSDLNVLISKTHDSVKKHKYHVESIILRSLVSTNLENLADLMLMEDFAEDMIRAANSNFPEPYSFLNETPDFLNILIRRNEKNLRAVNLYGIEGNHSFSRQFNEILYEIFKVFYKYLAGEYSKEYLIEFINTITSTLLKEYRPTREREDSDNRKFAEVQLNFIEEVTEVDRSIAAIEGQQDDEHVIKYLAKILEVSITEKTKTYDENFRREFVKEYYTLLKSGESRISEELLDIGSASRYRRKLLAGLILRNQDLARKYNFEFEIKYTDEGYVLQVSHEFFKGFKLKLNSAEVELFVEEEASLEIDYFFAQDLLNCINEVIFHDSSIEIADLNESEIDSVLDQYIIEYVKDNSDKDSETLQAKLEFIKLYYKRLLKGNSRIKARTGELILSREKCIEYRNSFVLSLVLKYPEVGNTYGFNIEGKSIGENIVITLSHEYFKGLNFTVTIPRIDLPSSISIISSFKSKIAPFVRQKSQIPTFNVKVEKRKELTLEKIRQTYFVESALGGNVSYTFRRDPILSTKEVDALKDRISVELQRVIRKAVMERRRFDELEARFLLSILNPDNLES